MNIQYVILGFLSEGAKSGYDIKRKMEISVSHFFDASFGAIYPALRKMEKEGSVEKKVVQQEGKPNKNLYVITDKGKGEFQEYMMSPINPTTMRSDFLIRIFFGRYTTKENMIVWMKNEQEKAQLQMEKFASIKNQFQIDPFEMITLNYGLELAKLNIKLLDEQISRLENENE